ncbi:hypothetical protein HLB35_11285 [Halomonas sp. TBZ9]|uniref:LPS-assembly lipoprotein LptE n=1 Tax=Vreelandella azerica TaxID=2732867 RepID=A0A7Y3TY23_9GAMM|nr:hypothetical protein [Halomonas azerica]NOG32195.1 hypothetical protein [Halomonas azerica]
MKRRHFLRLTLMTGMAASAAVLGGCGFQLRGTQRQRHIPPIALDGDTRSLVARNLTVELNNLGNGIDEEAPWRLTLSSPTLEQRRLGGEDSGSQEHEFTLEIQVSVQERSSGGYALNNQTLSVISRQRLNDDDLLNRESLIEETRLTLSRRLAQRVVERISALEAFE